MINKGLQIDITIILKVLMFVSIGVIAAIEVFNNIILRATTNVSDSMLSVYKVLRMELWPTHLAAGVIFSFLFAFFVYKTNKDIKMRVIAGLLIWSGISLIVFENKFILITHIILSLIAVMIIFYDSKKFWLYSVATVCWGFFAESLFITYFKLNKSILMEKILTGFQLADQPFNPIDIPVIAETINKNMNLLVSLTSIIALVIIAMCVKEQNKKHTQK